MVERVAVCGLLVGWERLCVLLRLPLLCGRFGRAARLVGGCWVRGLCVLVRGCFVGARSLVLRGLLFGVCLLRSFLACSLVRRVWDAATLRWAWPVIPGCGAALGCWCLSWAGKQHPTHLFSFEQPLRGGDQTCFNKF